MRSIVIAGALFVAAATTASAEEVTLRAVSAFAECTEFSRNFERFVEKVNADGKGLIKINYIGGAPAGPPFVGGKAVGAPGGGLANGKGAGYSHPLAAAEGVTINSKATGGEGQHRPS